MESSLPHNQDEDEDKRRKRQPIAIFYEDETKAIQRTVDVRASDNISVINDADFEQFYEINRTIECIKTNGFKRV